jgi:hypothetical protein
MSLIKRKVSEASSVINFGIIIGGVNMNKKWTIENISDYVKKNSDSELLSTEYRGFSQKLLFKCSCGNNFEKTLTKFKASNQKKCSNCSEVRTSRTSKK